jgi:hypothetical protein
MDPNDPSSVSSKLNKGLSKVIDPLLEAEQRGIYGDEAFRVREELLRRQGKTPFGDAMSRLGSDPSLSNLANLKTVTDRYTPRNLFPYLVRGYTGSPTEQRLRQEASNIADRIEETPEQREEREPKQAEFQQTVDDVLAGKYGYDTTPAPAQIRGEQRAPQAKTRETALGRAAESAGLLYPLDKDGNPIRTQEQLRQRQQTREQQAALAGQSFVAGATTPQLAATQRAATEQRNRGELDDYVLGYQGRRISPMRTAAEEALAQGVMTGAAKAGVKAAGAFARSDAGKRLATGVRTGIDRMGNTAARFDDAVYRRLRPERFTDEGGEILMEGTTPRRRMPDGDMTDVTPQPTPDAPTSPTRITLEEFQQRMDRLEGAKPLRDMTPEEKQKYYSELDELIAAQQAGFVSPDAPVPDTPDLPASPVTQMEFNFDPNARPVVTQPEPGDPLPPVEPETREQFLLDVADDLAAQPPRDDEPLSELRSEREFPLDSEENVASFMEELERMLNARDEADGPFPDLEAPTPGSLQSFLDDATPDTPETAAPTPEPAPEPPIENLGYSVDERDALIEEAFPLGQTFDGKAIFFRTTGAPQDANQIRGVSSYAQALGAGMQRVALNYMDGAPIFSSYADMLHFLSAHMLDDLAVDMQLRISYGTDQIEQMQEALRHPIIAQTLNELLRATEEFLPTAVREAFELSPAPSQDKLQMIKAITGAGLPSRSLPAPLAADGPGGPEALELITTPAMYRQLNRASRLFSRVFSAMRDAGRLEDASFDFGNRMRDFTDYTGLSLYRLPQSLEQGKLDPQELKYALNYTAQAAPTSVERTSSGPGTLLFGPDTNIADDNASLTYVRQHLYDNYSNVFIDRDAPQQGLTIEVPNSFLKGLEQLAQNYPAGLDTPISELQGYFKYAVRQSQADARRAIFNQSTGRASSPEYDSPINEREPTDNPTMLFSEPRVADIMQALDAVDPQTGSPYLASVYVDMPKSRYGIGAGPYSAFTDLPKYSGEMSAAIQQLADSEVNLKLFVKDPENLGPSMYTHPAPAENITDFFKGLLSYYRSRDPSSNYSRRLPNNYSYPASAPMTVQELINIGRMSETITPRPPVVGQGYDRAERAFLETASRALSEPQGREKEMLPSTYSRLTELLEKFDVENEGKVFVDTEDTPVIDRRTGEQRTRVIDGEVVPLVKPGTSARYQFLKSLGFAFDKNKQEFLPVSSKGSGILVSADEMRTRLEPALQYVQATKPEGFTAFDVLKATEDAAGYLPLRMQGDNQLLGTTILEYYDRTDDTRLTPGRIHQTNRFAGKDNPYRELNFENPHSDGHPYTEYVPEVDQLVNQKASGIRTYYVPTTDRLGSARHALSLMNTDWRRAEVLHRARRSRKAVRNYIGKLVSDNFKKSVAETYNSNPSQPPPTEMPSNSMEAIAHFLNNVNVIHDVMSTTSEIAGRGINIPDNLDSLVFPYDKDDIRDITQAMYAGQISKGPYDKRPMMRLLDKAADVFYEFISGPYGMSGQSPKGTFDSAHFGRANNSDLIPNTGGYSFNDHLGHARFTVGPVKGVEGEGLILIEQQFDIDQHVSRLGRLGDSPEETRLYTQVNKMARLEDRLAPLAQELTIRIESEAFNPDLDITDKDEFGQRLGYKLQHYTRQLERHIKDPSPYREEEVKDALDKVTRLGVSKGTISLINELVAMAPNAIRLPYHQSDLLNNMQFRFTVDGQAGARDDYLDFAEGVVNRIVSNISDETEGTFGVELQAFKDETDPGVARMFPYEKLPRSETTQLIDLKPFASPKRFQAWLETTDIYLGQPPQVPLITSLNQRLRLVAGDMLRQAYIADLDFIALPDAETILTSRGIGFDNAEGLRAVYDKHMPNTFARLLNADATDFPIVETTVNGGGIDNEAHIKIIPLTKEVKEMIRVQLNPEGTDVVRPLPDMSAPPPKADQQTYDPTATFTGKPNPLYAVPFAAMAGEAARRAMNKEEEPSREN